MFVNQYHRHDPADAELVRNVRYPTCIPLIMEVPRPPRQLPQRRLRLPEDIECVII